MIATPELPTTILLLMGLVAVVAGALGSAMGVGGGLVLVPALITLFHIDTEHARAASLVAVAVTSMGGTLIYLKEKSVDFVAGGAMQLPTAVGAVAGAFLGNALDPSVVRVLFAALLLAVAARLAIQARREAGSPPPETLPLPRDRRTWLLAGAGCLGAGLVSSMLGVGGGIVFVPVLSLLLLKSARAASATSTYLIGLTGAASALIYVRALTSEGPDPKLVAIAIPAAIGIFVGAQLGARLSKRISGPTLRTAFSILMVVNAGMLIWKVAHG